MFGFSAERPMFSWLLSHLGPPPPPPRRYFSRSWDYDPEHWAAARLPWPGPGAERRDTEDRHDPSGS
jgi:hypothetical protein